MERGRDEWIIVISEPVALASFTVKYFRTAGDTAAGADGCHSERDHITENWSECLTHRSEKEAYGGVISLGMQGRRGSFRIGGDDGSGEGDKSGSGTHQLRDGFS